MQIKNYSKRKCSGGTYHSKYWSIRYNTSNKFIILLEGIQNSKLKLSQWNHICDIIYYFVNFHNRRTLFSWFEAVVF